MQQRRAEIGYILLAIAGLLLATLACATPFSSLPEDAFIAAEGIEASRGEILQVAAGEQLQLRLGQVQCCVFTEPIDARLRWSIEEQEGVSINSMTGLMKVDLSVPDGTRVNVNASTFLGAQEFEGEIVVYQPESNRLVGTWREVGQISCQGGSELPVETPIREFVLQADGSFQVTWFPFEAYVDYVGEYQASDGGAFQLEPREVNYLPRVMDVDGLYHFDDSNRLVLTNLWLGSPPGESSQTRCGHIFER
jgi:hypothetical protein